MHAESLCASRAAPRSDAMETVGRTKYCSAVLECSTTITCSTTKNKLSWAYLPAPPFLTGGKSNTTDTECFWYQSDTCTPLDTAPTRTPENKDWATRVERWETKAKPVCKYDWLLSHWECIRVEKKLPSARRIHAEVRSSAAVLVLTYLFQNPQTVQS